MSTLDSRLNAFRPDLADLRLKSIVEAPRYANGSPRQVSAPIAAVRREPYTAATQITQALMGEACRVFETREGWAWVQLDADHYVGYIAEDALSAATAEPSHRVAVVSTFIYPAPNIKAQPVTPVPLNAKVAIAGREGKFAALKNGGFVFAAHLKMVAEVEHDFVAVCELFQNVPYLWGGKSSAGLDCSGLVQLSLEAAGMACPRDTDMQERALGRPLHLGDLDSLQRGDLVFWNGHVGVMANASDLIHANGHHMSVAREPLSDAVARIKASHGEITSLKRL
jgi:cell wall-associated NlpC family hydrolase